MMAAHRLKGCRDTIVLNLIITGYYPNFALMFHPYLCRAYNMPGGEKAYLHPVLHYFFAVLNGLQVEFAESVQEHLAREMVRQVMFVARVGMVGVGVGNHC